MFSRLSLASLIELCRALRHYLGAGLSLEEVFRGQATRGPASVRPIADRVSQVLKRGHSLEKALEPEKKHFPPLFLALARVGERTGMLPEIFGELERYFLNQQSLRRKLIGLTAWPLIQFFLAVGVLALVILILGALPPATTPSGQRWDPLGLGLFGVSGALIFVGIVLGAIAGLWLLGWLTGKLLPGGLRDRILLALPALGPCLQALALNRFCLALRLTTESGMAIDRAIRLSMGATGNDAFVAASSLAEQTVRDGDDLTLALSRTNLMPSDFLRIIQVAEESGTLSDVLRHQADHYSEAAGRRMMVVAFLITVLVWLTVGVFIVVFIFRIFLSYLNIIDSLAS